MQGERLLWLPLAVEPAVDGRELPDLFHLLGVVVVHRDHDLRSQQSEKLKLGQRVQATLASLCEG